MTNLRGYQVRFVLRGKRVRISINDLFLIYAYITLCSFQFKYRTVSDESSFYSTVRVVEYLRLSTTRSGYFASANVRTKCSHRDVGSSCRGLLSRTFGHCPRIRRLTVSYTRHNGTCREVNCDSIFHLSGSPIILPVEV